MIRTAITGSRGFIGRHLHKKLPHACQLIHDGIIFGHSYPSEQMFFLSAYGNMRHHTDYRMMVKANVQDVITVLKGFNGWFCYMSSSSVMLPVQTPYSHTKKAAEEMLQALPDIKVCIVRPYSVTGVGEQREHLIPTLIRSCIEGEEMMFDPSPVHDFVDVEDVVDGLVRAANEGETGIHEFGTGSCYSNQSVRELVEGATGRKANIKNVGRLREYDNYEWFCRNPSPVFWETKPLVKSIMEMVEDYILTH